MMFPCITEGQIKWQRLHSIVSPRKLKVTVNRCLIKKLLMARVELYIFLFVNNLVSIFFKDVNLSSH